MPKPHAANQGHAASSTLTERRVWVRYSVDLEYTCQPLAVGGESRWLGKVLNISRGGVCLVINRRFERGTILVVELQDAAGSAAGPALARVAHCTQQGPGDWLIGCAFVRELNDEELRAFVPSAD